MSAADAATRLLVLVPWLLERPGASLAETAAAFGVDEATLRDDLSHLDFCGLPGLGGGDLFEVDLIGDRILVRMADELRRPLRLQPHEALRLLLVGEAVAAALGNELPPLRAALDKVRAATGMPAGVTVEVEDDGSRWLEPLRAALDRGQRVRLAYRGRADDQPVTRTVDPWELHVAGGTWYLQGHDEAAGGLRSFRLDRVASVQVLEERRAVERPDEPLPPPRYTAAPDDVEVELVLPPTAGWVAEAVVADAVEDLPDGRQRLRFRTDALAWVVRLLLVAGPGVEVVHPGELATALSTEAARALARYRSDG